MLRVQGLQRLADERLCLAPGCSVADGDGLRVVFRHDHRDCLRALLRLLHREDHGLAEILARSVHHRHLAAGAYAGVDGKHCLLAQRARKEKVAQVLGEHLYCRAVGLHLLVGGDFHFAARRKKPLVCVVRGGLELAERDGI